MSRLIFLSGLIGLVLFASLSLADIPKLINYQGMLTQSDGATPVQDGTYDLGFKIYGSESGTDSLWWEYHSSVNVTNGLFNIILGSVTPLDLPFDATYWLEIKVGGELMPERLKFTSVGYAYRARVADSAAVAGSGGGGGWVDDGTVVRLQDSTDAVGIGTMSPGYQLHVIDCRNNTAVFGKTQNYNNYGCLGNVTSGVFGNSSTGSGVYGYSNSNGTGVYGYSNSGTGVYYSGGLAGSGSKSCVVKTSKGPTLLYCQESPENWFEDFGEAQLSAGRCHIELDPLFLETVTINEPNPMKVFIQLNDDCNGTYVERGRTGFDVIELQGGQSNARFTYRVVAKRSGFEDKRLDVCEAAKTDPYLYPEMKEKVDRE